MSPAARSRLAVGEAGATGDAGADILRSAVRYGAPPAAAARACPPRSKGAAPSVLPVCRLRLDGVPNSTVCRGRSRGVAAFPPLLLFGTFVLRARNTTGKQQVRWA